MTSGCSRRSCVRWADVRAAVFLDRDGTLMHDRHFVSRPEDVELFDDAAHAVRALSDAGFATVLVTNQSGIGRGLFTSDDYERVQGRLTELLAGGDARLEATYFCPHAPGDDCECRKPGTLLFRRAARDLGLDLARSWSIGDRWRDLEPAIALGARGVLVPRGDTDPEEIERARREAYVAPSLARAVEHILERAAAMPRAAAR